MELINYFLCWFIYWVIFIFLIYSSFPNYGIKMWLRNCGLGAFMSCFWTLSFCKITWNNCFIFGNNINCNTHTPSALSEITLAWLGRRKLSKVTSCTELTCRHLKKRWCDGSFLFERSWLHLHLEHSLLVPWVFLRIPEVERNWGVSTTATVI